VSEHAESYPPAAWQPEIVPPAPAFVVPEPADDLGFSLDWSEPDSAQAADMAAGVVALPNAPSLDDLGFSLDWSDPQIDPYAGAQLPNTEPTVDSSIVMAHWNDQDLSAQWNDQDSSVSEPSLFGNQPTSADGSEAMVAENPDRWPAVEPDPEPFEPQQAQESLPIALEQNLEGDETPIFAEQEAPPWYAPTLDYGDRLPFQPSADAPLETYRAAWIDAPEASQPSLASAEIVPDAPLEAFEPAWDDTPILSEPGTFIASDAGFQPAAEPVSAEPAREMASEQVLAEASEQIEQRAEPTSEVSPELIARLIGMIQSYGPAWFKMWSLELNERPERLPVVLGEVTADALLLAQAEDSRVQSALLAALAAYSSPRVHPSRLPSAALPSPVMASQSNDDHDEVPDWLSLRTKWNGHGGGA
jgi:hypothetical protein